MSHSSPGYGDPCTWGAPAGHPNDPRNDVEKNEQRIQQLTASFRQHIRRRVVDHDETAIRVADQLIRYLTDIEVVDIIRPVMQGRKEAAFQALRDLVSEAVDGLAQQQAIRQFEQESSPFFQPSPPTPYPFPGETPCHKTPTGSSVF